LDYIQYTNFFRLSFSHPSQTRICFYSFERSHIFGVVTRDFCLQIFIYYCHIGLCRLTTTNILLKNFFNRFRIFNHHKLP
jgi:hypothetical protein